MKIVFFNTNIGYGGASKMLISVANSLSEEHDVTILTYRSAEIRQSLAKKVKVVFDPLYKNRCKPLENIGQIIALRNYLRKNRVDLIVAFLHPSNYMAVLAATGLKTKVLLSERGDPYSRLKNGGIFTHLVEKIIQKADAYVFQSEGARNAYSSRCQANSQVIVNAIPDVEYPVYSPDDEKRILSVARFETIQKRQDILVKAFALFSKKHPEYKLSFAGDGPNESEIKSLVDSLGLSEKVDFLGANKNVLDLLSRATFFVLSSDYEGLPNALLESMSVGVPSISTDCSPGGARMIIENGENGLIVPCGDENQLAKAMEYLAEHDDVRDAFSKKAVLVKEKFNHKKIEKQWKQYIKELIM